MRIENLAAQQHNVTLFLVEDDDVDVLQIQRLFSKKQIKNPLIRAKDGLDALQRIRSGEIPKPFVILLDVQMPRMNGIEFLTALRGEQNYQDSIVFVLSTSANDEDINKSYNLNVAGYLVKGDNPADLSNVMELLQKYWSTVKLPAH